MGPPAKVSLKPRPPRAAFSLRAVLLTLVLQTNSERDKGEDAFSIREGKAPEGNSRQVREGTVRHQAALSVWQMVPVACLAKQGIRRQR